MQDSKLIEFVRTFSADQLKACIGFISFKNVEPEVVRLVEYIVKHLHDEKALEKELVYKKLKLGSPYNDLKLRRYMSKLNKNLKQFIAFDLFSQNELAVESQLTAFYLKGTLKKHTKPNLDKRKNITEKAQNRSSEYYISKYQLSQHNMQYFEKYDGRFHMSELTNSLYFLEQYYLIERLKIVCAILSNPQSSLEETDIAEIKQFALGLPDDKNNVALSIYKKAVLLLLQHDDDTFYPQYKEMLLAHHSVFSRTETTDLFLIAINYCIIKSNRGELSFLSELLSLYRFSIENNLLIVNGNLSPWSYKNTISAALRLKEFDYVEHFIDNFSNKLPSNEKENAVRFNKARLHFSRKEYFKVLRLLQEVEYTDVFYNLDGKTLLLKTYYELDEIEVMFSLISSFRQLLNRKKLLSERHRLKTK